MPCPRLRGHEGPFSRYFATCPRQRGHGTRLLSTGTSYGRQTVDNCPRKPRSGERGYGSGECLRCPRIRPGVRWADAPPDEQSPACQTSGHCFRRDKRPEVPRFPAKTFSAAKQDCRRAPFMPCLDQRPRITTGKRFPFSRQGTQPVSPVSNQIAALPFVGTVTPMNEPTFVCARGRELSYSPSTA